MVATDPSVSGAQQTMERLLRLMVLKNGSDLYISANAQPTMRLHGLCVPASSRALGPQDPAQLLAVLIGEQSVTALRPPLTMQKMVSLQDGGRLRVQVFFQRGALAFSARYLPATLPTIGHAQGQLSPVLQSLAKAPAGLLLISGAAGAGKSTTAAAMLECRNTEISGHILALERNPEYTLISKKSLINQQHIGLDVASWPSAFGLAHQCAADVIYIDEIDDHASAAAALGLAQTGALCIATLNATTPADALVRFLQYFPDGQRIGAQMQLGTALRAVVSQKLMRTKAGPRVAVVEVLGPADHIVRHLERGEFNALKDLDLSQLPSCQSQAQDMVRMQNAGTNFEDHIPQAPSGVAMSSWSNTTFAEGADLGLPQPPSTASAFSTPITLSLRP